LIRLRGHIHTDPSETLPRSTPKAPIGGIVIAALALGLGAPFDFVPKRTSTTPRRARDARVAQAAASARGVVMSARLRLLVLVGLVVAAWLTTTVTLALADVRL
jgi:hypothetical protein